MQEWSVPAWVAAFGLGALVLTTVILAMVLAALRRARRRTDEELARARAEAADLRSQVDDIRRRLAATEGATDSEFVITRVGDLPVTAPVAAAPVVPGPLFADLVLREGVVQTASLLAGLRRALSPEVRHRIRFEMRREVKRARKQRRADLREARREWQARQRSGLRPDEPTAVA